MSSRIPAPRVPPPARDDEGAPRDSKWGGGAKTKAQLGRERKVRQDRLDSMIAARVRPGTPPRPCPAHGRGVPSRLARGRAGGDYCSWPRGTGLLQGRAGQS